jgi:uncharacterized protein
MTPAGDENLRDRLHRALPTAMKARDRPALTALRSALAAIDNAEAVNPPQTSPGTRDPEIASGTRHPVIPDTGTGHPTSIGAGAGHSDLVARGASHPELAGTVAGVGATEVERRRLSQTEMEEIVRAEIAERETAAAGYERAGQLEHAERLRAEAKVLLSHLNTT